MTIAAKGTSICPSIEESIAAVQRRISERAYSAAPVDGRIIDELAAYIDELNGESGLHFQLYGPRAEGRDAITMSASMFAGQVFHYAALVAPDDTLAGEKVGYYGEKFILRATSLGLGTCWVASTYDKESTRVDCAPGERLWDVVPLGYAMEKTPLKQRTIRKTIRSHSKTAPEFIQSSTPYDELPDWVKRGLEMVVLAPSAVNGQPVLFSYENGVLTATMPQVKRDVQFNDLGIAKLHFQIGAEACGVFGDWEWGLEGRFAL